MAAPIRPQDFLFDIAASANNSEQLVRDAWNAYESPVDYGLVPWGLEKVAALIAADFPTKVYYVPYRNNAFDTHVYQGDLHARLWSYTSDHIAAFVRDMERLGRGDDVVVMVFTEFGRRVAENTSLGTDHGTAGPAFVIGKPVTGGQYGRMPSLTDLDDGNLKFTTDYRRIYSTLINGWMQHDQASAILRDEFSPDPDLLTHQLTTTSQGGTMFKSILPALAGLTLLAMSAGAHAQDMLELKLATGEVDINPTTNSILKLADRLGFYEKHGVKVDDRRARRHAAVGRGAHLRRRRYRRYRHRRGDPAQRRQRHQAQGPHLGRLRRGVHDRRQDRHHQPRPISPAAPTPSPTMAASTTT